MQTSQKDLSAAHKITSCPQQIPSIRKLKFKTCSAEVKSLKTLHLISKGKKEEYPEYSARAEMSRQKFPSEMTKILSDVMMEFTQGSLS